MATTVRTSPRAVASRPLNYRTGKEKLPCTICDNRSLVLDTSLYHPHFEDIEDFVLTKTLLTSCVHLQASHYLQ